MSNKQKKKKKSSTLSNLMIGVLIGIICVCLFKLGPYYLSRGKSKKDYQKMADKVVQTSTEAEDSTGDTKPVNDDWWYKDVKVDLASLQKINSETAAWVRFDHPKQICVNYPVMACGSDEKYLHHNIYGKYSYPGVLFLSKDNSTDLSDYSQIIYGHNMRNGTMFGTLKRLKDKRIYKKNQYFTIYTIDMAYRYRIFSVFATKVGSRVYTTGYAPDKEYQSYLHYLKANSEFNTHVKVSKEDPTTILSTCTSSSDNSRFVVCGILVDEHGYDGGSN